MSQVRPPLPLQHPIPGQHSQPPLPDNIQQSYLSHLPASQNGSSNHPVLPNGEQTGRTADMLEIKNHPSKRPKLEDGGGAIGSGPALSIDPGSGPGSQMVNADAEKQVPQKLLRIAADKHPGVEQYAIRSFSEALDSVLMALAENSGLQPIDTLTAVKSQQIKELAEMIFQSAL